jgi:hypothetical protein
VSGIQNSFIDILVRRHRIQRATLRLGVDDHTVLVRAPLHGAEVIFRDELLDRAAEITQRRLGERRALHHAAREHGQQRHEIVALEGAELGGEGVRPVLRAAFEAVEEQSLERAAHLRAGLAQDAAERLIKVERDGVGIHFVDLKAVALGHGGMVRRTRRGESET